jgi:hypothetical protein
MILLKHIVLLFALVVTIRGQQNYQQIYDDFAFNCAVRIGDYTWADNAPTFYLSRFNDEAYRVKEVKLHLNPQINLFSASYYLLNYKGI